MSALNNTFESVNDEEDPDNRRADDAAAVGRAGVAGQLVVVGPPGPHLHVAAVRPSSSSTSSTARNGPAIEPIRAYAGLNSADGIKATAELAARELQRTGGLNRKVVAVATTTGTGWINEAEASALEYMYNGDTAIVSMQYSFLPSWLSFLVDKENARQAGQALFEAVDALVREMPENQRPKLVVFGESLGSFGGEAPFLALNNLVARTDGALFSGPTFNNTIWTDLTRNRDAGSPEWLPIFDKGENVRFVAKSDNLDRPADPWGSPRVVYLQHASDPIAWWNPDLLFAKPDWLREPRGYDVSARMEWIPVVTFLQVSADMAVAVDVPDGHGHVYVRDVANAWAAILQPPGWTAAEDGASCGRCCARTTFLERRQLSAGSTPAAFSALVAADHVGGAVQAEVDQRRRGQARRVALRAQHDPFDVVTDGLGQPRVAGGVAAPLEHVAFDDQCGGDVALARPLRGGPDVDEQGAPAQRGGHVARLDARQLGARGLQHGVNTTQRAAHQSPSGLSVSSVRSRRSVFRSVTS